MQKYVVKNCPVYKPEIYKDCCDIDGNYKCKDIDNCLIKQVIEKCKEAISTYDNEEFYEDDCDYYLGQSHMAQEILELFEVKE